MELALKVNMTIEDLANTIFPFLAGAEGLKLAAQTLDKDVSTLSYCAGYQVRSLIAVIAA